MTHTNTEAVSDEAERARVYIRNWCPDYVKDYVSELSRRAANSAGGVEVKGLVWRGPFEAFPSTMWETETPFGRYEIEEQNASDSPVYELRFNMKVVAIEDGVPEIQECAQADFKQRILSAIEVRS